MATPSDEHPTAEQLAAFDRGQTPLGERSSVERHIAHCDACCEKLERLPDDTILRLVRATQHDPTATESVGNAIFPSGPVEPPPEC